jgi:uncharacterized protein
MNVEQSAYILSPELVELSANAHHAVYHRLRGGLCLLDDAARAVLHEFKSPSPIEEGLLAREHSSPREELIQQFLLRDFLVRAENSHASIPANEKGKVSVIQLIMINHCNFGCKYCFLGEQGSDTKGRDATNELVRIEGLRSKPNDIRVNLGDSIFASAERLEHQYDPKNRTMTPAGAVEYTRAAIETAKATGAKEVMIQFFGGEPMMNWRACKAVLLAFGHGENEGIRIHYSTVTNGSVITEEIAEMLARYRVAVCVSFDSSNSKQRPLKDGSDSAPVVKEGLRKLQEHGNYIAINAALTSDTWAEFDESIVEVAREYGAREIGVVIDFDPTFYERYSPTEVVNKLWTVIVEGARYGIVLTGYWHQIFQVLTDFDAVSRRGFKNCSAKGAQLSIEPNGSVFSCKAGSGFFGSITDGPEILESETYRAHASLRYKNPSFCNGCEIEGFCAGLCLGPIEKKFGVVNAIEPAACGVYRGITQQMIRSVKPYQVATFELGKATTT